jgi:MFS transporter, BCD family, chlorophyll transporter
LALGAWGAVQATCAGLAIMVAGFLRDSISHLAMSGALGTALTHPAVGYIAVYGIEVVLLIAMLVTVGPLARFESEMPEEERNSFGLAQFPS